MWSRAWGYIRHAFRFETLLSNTIFLAVTLVVGIVLRAAADVPFPYLIAGGLVFFLLLVAGWLQRSKWHLARAARPGCEAGGGATTHPRAA